MKIIIGLGNPGEKYKDTRHNIGFFFANLIQREWDFSTFAYNKKFDTEISVSSRAENGGVEGSNQKIILAKPATFMNISGVAVRAILDFYKLTADDIIVIHDDLDIAVGSYKISRNVSSAGHNGIDSIIEKIGTQDFTRIRIGVEMKAGRQARQISGEDFVLQKFTEDEIKKIEEIEKNILKEIENLL